MGISDRFDQFKDKAQDAAHRAKEHLDEGREKKGDRSREAEGGRRGERDTGSGERPGRERGAPERGTGEHTRHRTHEHGGHGGHRREQARRDDTRERGEHD
ncbi:hypothetical protein GCM10027160_22990 [Streptomyces calidiresistens]|uniref:Uncharacterized protein n=1 Tax=Streptomyces calidiresistens TaxID=1485586 RepID=A0A7W3T4S5_9ACTN|nr:hypothetical protein [Streptomyces calidiresistens]MBB0230940.1 hypothetical protein [Streptomyces calidiresistens]